MTVTVAPPKPTDYGSRLANADPAVRDKAQAELAAMGDRAKDILLTELDQCGQTQPVSMMILMFLIQVPNFLRPFLEHGPRKNVFSFLHSLVLVVLLISYLVIWRKHRQKYRKQSTTLALAIARYDDPEVLGTLMPLARLASRGSLTPEEVQLQRELSRLFTLHLSSPTKQFFHSGFENNLRDTLGKLYPSHRRGLAKWTRKHMDFADSQADLLASIAQVFAVSYNTMDHAVLERMAATESPLPNRRFVQEIAMVLTSPPPAKTTTLVRPLPAALSPQTPVPVPLTLKRQ